VVCLQHGHAVLHPDAEAILAGIAEGMAEVVARAVKYHQMAFVIFQWDALRLYEPAQRQWRAGTRAKAKKKFGDNLAKISAKS